MLGVPLKQKKRKTIGNLSFLHQKKVIIHFHDKTDPIEILFRKLAVNNKNHRYFKTNTGAADDVTKEAPVILYRRSTHTHTHTRAHP